MPLAAAQSLTDADHKESSAWWKPRGVVFNSFPKRILMITGLVLKMPFERPTVTWSWLARSARKSNTTLRCVSIHEIHSCLITKPSPLVDMLTLSRRWIWVSLDWTRCCRRCDTRATGRCTHFGSSWLLQGMSECRLVSTEKKEKGFSDHACTQRKPELCWQAKENAQTFSTISVDSMLIYKTAFCLSNWKEEKYRSFISTSLWSRVCRMLEIGLKNLHRSILEASKW